MGSDLDLLILVEFSRRPFIDRPLDFDLSSLPVPAEALVYTPSEWDALAIQSPHFYTTTLLSDSVPIFERSHEES